MQDERENGYIPKYLDAQEKFVFWDMDQAIIGLTLMGMGIALDAFVIGTAGGGWAAWQWGRLKAGKHPRFAMHMLYWWLPPQFTTALIRRKVTPPSDLRSFLG